LSGDSALTTCNIAIRNLQRTVSFNWDKGGNLFAAVTNDGMTWKWHNLVNDRSGRVAGFGSLGAFSYVRVTSSPTSRFFTPVLVAAARYVDGSLALNVWDGEGTSHWANLGSPAGGAAGRPCGAGFYVGSQGTEVETAIVITSTVDRQIFLNKPGAFGREWISLGLPAN
jgi:hypothetical protein